LNKLIISCSDKLGLIFNITKVLFENNLNIETQNEYVDKESNRFFLRTKFTGNYNKNDLIQKIKHILPTDSNIKITDNKNKKIVIFATKESHALGDILIKHYDNILPIDILCVISNHENLRNLVDKFNIKYHYVSHLNITKQEHEKSILNILSQYNVDLFVLAKYMRILSPDFIKDYNQKIINIHHSFLPAFIGQNPYKQACDRGVKIIGATAHFVTDKLDDGPIIKQDITPIDHTHSWHQMKIIGQDIERKVLSDAIKLAIEDRIIIYNNKTIIL
jgi:formyltetrahydrofolate deformylase